MQKTLFPALIAALVLAGLPSAALAYIGPGVGAGAIAAVLGVLGSIFLAIVAVLTVSVFRLHHSRFGRAMIAVRDNDVAAEVMGIPVLRVKVMSFFVGSLFAGIAGACMAYFLQFVTASSFTLFASVWYLGMLIVGGLHSPLGAILGVVFITAVQESLHKVANT
ncbi:MAG: branched-chain amino acid ABC transporter permease, partial [Albidovulum sp.]